MNDCEVTAPSASAAACCDSSAAASATSTSSPSYPFGKNKSNNHINPDSTTTPTNNKSSSNAPPPVNDVLEDIFRSDHQLQVFAQQIGPYEEVLGNAQRWAQLFLSDTIYCYNSGMDHHRPVTNERFAYPATANSNSSGKKTPLFKGPQIDLCVYAGLFLDQEGPLRQQLERHEQGPIRAMGAVAQDALRRDAAALSLVDLARNVRRYLLEVVAPQGPVRLLRFCAIYGLSGALNEVLYGKYGDIGSLTIDSLLPVHDDDMTEEGVEVIYSDEADAEQRGERTLHLPVYAIAAVLGHVNVVRQAVQKWKADIHVPLCYSLPRTTTATTTTSLQVLEPHLSGAVLWWCIKTNQLEMVRCLVQDCNFQFRWLSQEQLRDLYHCLFHIGAPLADELGVWRARSYEHDRHREEDEDQRYYRSQCCFGEKQIMLRLLIELGLPWELFVPQINVAAEEKLMRDMQAQNLTNAPPDMVRDLARASGRLAFKARRELALACVEVNYYRDRLDGLTMVAFFNDFLKNGMWKDQPVVQETILPQYEEWDPRWKRCEAFVPWWGFVESGDIPT